MRKKWKYIRLLLAVFISVLAFLFLAKVIFLAFFPDFYIYYTATKIALHGGDPYRTVDGLAAFIYPPVSMYIFIPFTLFSSFIAGKLWTILSISLFVTSLCLLRSILSSFVSLPQFLIMCALCFLAFPTRFSLGMGQVNILIFFLITVSLYFYLRKQINAAGIFLGLSLSLKFFPIFLLFYLLLKKNYVLLFVICLTLFLSLLLPLLFLSPSIVQSYWTIHFFDVFHSIPGAYYNQSFAAFLVRQFGRGDLVLVCKNIVTFFWIVFIVLQLRRVTKRTREIILLEWSSVLIPSVFLSTIAWQHHYVLLFISYFLLTGYVIKKRRWILLFVLGISYLLVSINLPNPVVFPILIQSHVFIGGVLVWGVNYYLIRRTHV